MYDDIKEETVKVSLSLTKEAARILYQYAGERGRGWFVSQLLLQQRKMDDEEGERWSQSIAHGSTVDAGTNVT